MAALSPQYSGRGITRRHILVRVILQVAHYIRFGDAAAFAATDNDGGFQIVFIEQSPHRRT